MRIGKTTGLKTRKVFPFREKSGVTIIWEHEGVLGRT